MKGNAAPHVADVTVLHQGHSASSVGNFTLLYHGGFGLDLPGKPQGPSKSLPEP